MFIKNVRIAIIVLASFTVLTGLLYPLAVTGIAQLVFPHKANGSLIEKDGKMIGSELIGQPFDSPKYFWSRLSATRPYAYNAGSSTGTNYGPLNPAFLEGVKKRTQELKTSDSLNPQPVPADLATASSSGLDPHISVSAAQFQVARVARNRNMSLEQVQRIVDQLTEGRQLGFFGEARVNVLELNLALDATQSAQGGK